MAYDPQLDSEDVEAQRRQSEEFRNRPENKAKLAELDEYIKQSEARDRILRRADEVAEKATEKAANERKSGSEARKLSSEARLRFLSRAGIGSAGGIGGPSGGIDIEGLPKKLKPGPKNMKKGGKVSSASKRADGIAQRGKTKGRYI